MAGYGNRGSDPRERLEDWLTYVLVIVFVCALLMAITEQMYP